MNARQRARIQARIQKLEARSHRISWWRLLFFGASIALLVLTPPLLASFPALGFALLLRLHGRNKTLKLLLENRLKLADRQDATSKHDWARIPELPKIDAGPNLPPYLFELDILGDRSLLRLLNHTISSQGFDRLLSLFCSNDMSDLEITQRKALALETTALRVLRTRFLLLTQGTHQIDSRKISLLVQAPYTGPGATKAWLSTLVAQAILLVSFAWYFFGGGTPYFLGAAALLLLTHPLAKRQIFSGKAYDKALSLSSSLNRFRIATHVLERASKTKTPELKALLKPFVGVHSASTSLARLDTITGALGVRQNPVAFFLVHLVFPWDLFWTLRLERMRKLLQSQLPVWQAAVAEFEAFASIAQFAQANPEYVWAQSLPSGALKLRCAEAKHPLIDKAQAVGNDLTLTEPERCVLITGSNMSGKSTFLRTIGTNFLLAKAGAPVAARSFEFANLPLHSSLRVGDSVQEGLSSFHAEVRRLKEILDEARGGKQELYLIDEIFRGTNNRERLIGSRSYLRELTQTQSYGLVTTHDLELAALEGTYPSIVNYHFRESFSEGTMTFSYRKEKGPCPSTNALEVMRMNGLPVDAT